MKIAYADPPYPGCAHLYADHPDYAGEVDHAALVHRLWNEYDGFVLHTSAVALPFVSSLLPMKQTPAGPMPDGWRSMVWVKPFCAFKRNVSVAYAWEPVIVRACRKPVVTKRVVMRDFVTEECSPAISCSITLKKGLVGAKPPKVVRWAFEMVGAHEDDMLDDLFPGTGIVEKTWQEWQNERHIEKLLA